MTEIEASWIRNPDFIFRRIVEEMVLVPIRQDVADMDCIYTLNEVGAVLWESLSEARTQTQLEGLIFDAFDCEKETVSQDVKAFLESMVEIGAIKST